MKNKAVLEGLLFVVGDDGLDLDEGRQVLPELLHGVALGLDDRIIFFLHGFLLSFPTGTHRQAFAFLHDVGHRGVSIPQGHVRIIAAA